MGVIEITGENFEKEVLKSEKAVLVDFWAEWCGPCKKLSPLVDEISEQVDSLKFCKVNVDTCPELAIQYKVMSIPMLVIFKNGQAVKQSVGLISKNEFLDFVNNI